VPVSTPNGNIYSNNFNTHYGKGKLTVNPAALTVKANDATKVYGAADPTLSYTLTTPLKYQDAPSVVTGVVLTTTTGADATAGQHAIVPSGGTAANYALNYTNGTLNVTKAPLTVQVNNVTSRYMVIQILRSRSHIHHYPCFTQITRLTS
jgi:hypothetical protein